MGDERKGVDGCGVFIAEAINRRDENGDIHTGRGYRFVVSRPPRGYGRGEDRNVRPSTIFHCHEPTN